MRYQLRPRAHVKRDKASWSGFSARNGFLLSARELCVELVGYGVGHFAFHSKDIVEFAIVAFAHKYSAVAARISWTFTCTALATFAHCLRENAPRPTVGRSHASSRAYSCISGRGARDDLELGNLREPGQDLVMDAVGKVSIRFIVAEIWNGRTAMLFSETDDAGAPRPVM